MSMKFGKVSKTKDLNEYDDVRIVGKTFPHDETVRQVKVEKTVFMRVCGLGNKAKPYILHQIYTIWRKEMCRGRKIA